ncbi:YicC/YloC family endoribonuclease [uncultured Pseudoteredinibacter sp.]|uniref:YicC/YloC family endoribonuclease n=1 Tax=uncultured Pseudoteredinibacter sp. TaxID=1641701 RepID=UPI00262A9905|nr:YicC/YloC family endoribonuclease [uncultured Pseudoteredinibacter sp.]
MPRSMTGFARSEQQYPWGSISWELRSVNHRYLEPNFRLPEAHRGLEPNLREQIRNKLSRGKLDISLNIQLGSSENNQIGLNQELIEQLISANQQLQGLGDFSPLDPLELLKWPGVIIEDRVDGEQLKQDALSQFGQTIDQLIDSRNREGEELANMIEQRLQGISEQVTLVRGLMPQILKAQRDKLLERLSDLKADLDADRVEQEIVILAQKADVDEELDRLDTHVTEVRRTLKQKGAIGRRLDFLMQELNREANTLSSKSIVTDTTAAAVELKVLIEQMREQIQNIE